MKGFNIFISCFAEILSSESVSLVQLILTLGLACMNAVYIFGVYRVLTRKTFYSKQYNISVASVAMITTAIVFTVQSSVIISVGMVGALSIVRFRTAIKEPLDIVFLFWAVAVGVCYGAHMAEISIILSALLTFLIIGLDEVSAKRGYRLLILEAESVGCENKVLEQLREGCKQWKIITREPGNDSYKITIELRVKHEYQLMQMLKKITGVRSISLIAHERA